MNSTDLRDFRASQVEQGDLWEELQVRHTWIHIVRGMVQEGEIAKLGTVAFSLYVAIKSHTDMQTGNAWPSITHLAELIGVSNDTVERALKRLVKAGLLKVEKRGRSNVYSVIERIGLATPAGSPWGTAERKYASLKFSPFVDELQRLARTGNLPGDRAITINVTVNVQNITQGDNGTVTMNVQNVQVNSDNDLRQLLKKL